MSLLRTFVVCLLLLAAAPAAALAQLQSGSVFIKAVDEQGAAVPGVTITLSSPVLPQPLVAVTDSTGVYRFPGLIPGTYAARVSLTGFQTLVRENIVVVQNQTTTIDVAMRVSSVAEEITVSAAAPVVDTKSATVSVNLDAKLLETTPGGKDIWNILEYKIPGLVFDTPDVGGNQAGLQRAFTARGAPNSQNVQLLNGVNVGDPAAIGFSMNYYESATFENIQVSSGAQDISMGTAGTLINMVTRSGTNRFSGSSLFTYQGDRTQWDNVDEPLREAGFRDEANAVDYISNFNIQAGGPLLRNRLFYFGSFNDQRTHVNVPGFPAISPPQVPEILNDASTQDTTDIVSITGKLTWSLNPSNMVEVYANRQWYDKPNRGAGANVTRDSASFEDDTFPVFQVLWNTTVSPRMFGDTRVSYNNTTFPLLQKTSAQTITDATTGLRLRNRNTSQTMFRERLQITSNWQYFLSEFAGARHEFKVGIDHAYTPEAVTIERNGNVDLQFRSVQGNANQPPGPVRVDIFNTPLTLDRAVAATSLYAQDSLSYKRLTVIAGIRFERVEGYLPEQSHGDSQFFPPGTVIPNVNLGGGVTGDYTVRGSFDPVNNAPLWKNWAPRISGTYDLTGQGRTVLKASAGKYFEQIGTGTPGPNPNGSISQRYTWIDLDGDLSFDAGNATWNGSRYVGGEFGNLQSTTVPATAAAFDVERERSYINEFTVGFDHELFPLVRLGVNFIHRESKNIYDDIDLDIDRWNELYTPIEVTEQGRDGVFGTSDDRRITVYQQNDPNYVVQTVDRNDDRLGITYNGVEITVTKRFSDGWTFLGGYTYGKEEQDYVSLEDPNDFFVNAGGVSGGRRHLFKASGSYELPWQVVFGANMRLQSGQPVTRRVTIDDLTQGDITINAEPRGSETLPKLFTMDLRAGRFFTFGQSRVELSLDVYNVTNANTVYQVRNGTGLTNVRYAGDATAPVTQIPTFLSPTGFLGPRIMRFNVNVSFGR